MRATKFLVKTARESVKYLDFKTCHQQMHLKHFRGELICITCPFWRRLQNGFTLWKCISSIKISKMTSYHMIHNFSSITILRSPSTEIVLPEHVWKNGAKAVSNYAVKLLCTILGQSLHASFPKMKWKFIQLNCYMDISIW